MNSFFLPPSSSCEKRNLCEVSLKQKKYARHIWDSVEGHGLEMLVALSGWGGMDEYREWLYVWQRGWKDG